MNSWIQILVFGKFKRDKLFWTFSKTRDRKSRRGKIKIFGESEIGVSR